MGLPENAQRCVRLIDDCVCGAVVVNVGRLPFRELKEREKYAKKKNCVCSSLALPTGLFYMTAYDDEDDVKLLELGLHTNVIPHYAASPPPSPCIKCKMETTEMFTGKYYIII